jgi:hypothetical protein
MLTWLYDIFVAIVSLVMSFFGFDLKNRSVTFAADIKEEDEKKDDPKSDEVVSPNVDDITPPATE